MEKPPGLSGPARAITAGPYVTLGHEVVRPPNDRLPPVELSAFGAIGEDCPSR